MSVDEHGEVRDVRMVLLDDGRVALLGYSALDRFIDCCGEDQPWAVFETAKLGELHATKPFDLKLLDVPWPDDLRQAMREGQ
ncbi:SAV_915 family protein [Nocardioides limicola]|uniref:SAV_915 family protein n=1 Tax=Nocardioides limicola TaxID=2803368 RepID=UPI00193BE00B|nr:SAV_915 family protein [Nocardioides sp. DJM-14]